MVLRLHKWPQGLDSCLNCTSTPVEASYASRGLCTRCYDKHRRHGTLKKYEFLGASWKSTAKNPTLRAARKIGITITAMLVGEDPGVIRVWCKEGTPKNMQAIMDEALLIINSKNPDHRALLFPDDH